MSEKNPESTTRRVFNKIKSYISLKETLSDLTGTLVFSALETLVWEGGIKNPIPNLANGSGTLGGIYLYKEHQISPELSSRYSRGFYRSIAFAVAATALRMYVSEHENLESYFTDVFANTARYCAGFAIPYLLGAWAKGDDDGDDGDDDYEPTEPPETPEKKPLPEPPKPSPSLDDLPKPIRDRMAFKIPDPSKN